jgi:ATP/ADP translocase
MNLRQFKNSFLTFFFVSALFVAWLADHSDSRFQQRITLLISVLLLMLCILCAILIALPTRPKRATQRAKLTTVEQQNAAMFRHQPASANFRVRMTANEQKRKAANSRKRYTINPDHQAFNK